MSSRFTRRSPSSRSSRSSQAILVASVVGSILALTLVTGAGCKKGDESKTKAGNKAGDKTGSATDKTPAANDSTSLAGKTLTIYSGRGKKLVGPALDAFKKKTGIELKIKYGDTAELAAAILDEGKNSPADIFIAQDAGTLGFLAAKDLFSELSKDILDRAPATFRAKNGHWVGLTGRARVLVYKTTKVKADELPKTAAELTDAKWKGRVGWAPQNASFQAAVAAMVQLEGADAAKKWLLAMKANGPKDYPKNTPAVSAVSRGEIDVALVNHYYLYRLRAEGKVEDVENHYFRDGTAHSMVNLSGAAVLASSQKADLAHKLIAFLLSTDGQKIFVEGNHEFPVATDAKSPSGLPPIAELGAPSIDLAAIRDLKATNDLLRETNVLP